MANILIKITSAVGIAGRIIRPGETVEVDGPLARNLLHRGKAELATATMPVTLEDGESITALEE
ncbi:hypothetical protein [Pararhodobacter zhoushanensis]|uniref:hypothetical protein n=1 Tax=Pararhodobacter zhoushanensis TaxID=2479545 RepID=UPI000F8DB19A|nr:hypothetical protein [Pararhodobacter zhoushanensis]